MRPDTLAAMPSGRDLNPFRFSGPLAPEEMIDRDSEAEALLALAAGGHSFRLVGPRRYGKTTLLRRVLAAAEQEQFVTVLVDLLDVLSIGEIVVRIERGYDRLKGPVRRKVDSFFRSWNIGLALGGGGFTATLQRNPNVDAESVLLRLLELPAALFDRDGTTSLIVFDEIQDVLAVPGADGKIRSVIQHQGDAATYGFAGSAPGVMEQLFADPRRPLLDQAVPMRLDPLPIDAVATYVADRFMASGRDVGAALTPLLEFSRGHPQRSMMLAHYLWQRTPAGATADEATWVASLDQAAADAAPLMRAIWRALSVNERRVVRAIAATTTPLYSEETAAAVGIKRASIGRAVESLTSDADIIPGGRPVLTDPMFELWLRNRGLTPMSEDDLIDEE
jgi:uncharacterized protein